MSSCLFRSGIARLGGVPWSHARAIVPRTIATTNEKSTSEPERQKATKLSTKDRLKVLVRDYGSTVIVFHTTISLTSLGLSYLLVSRGIDVQALLTKMGFEQKSAIAAGAGTFAVAYAFHKVFAPVRLAITAGATPLIVRYLRTRGWVKMPIATATEEKP